MGKIVSRSFSGIAGHGEWVLSVGIAHTRTIGASATLSLARGRSRATWHIGSPTL